MSSDLCAKLRVGLVCLVLIGLFLGGCTDSQSKRQEHQGVEASAVPVIRHDTVFYKIGPQQAMPPDGKFEAGTRVEVIEEAGSYTLVRAEDGRQGYVSADAIIYPK
jgi:hypothetical protein